MIEADYIVIGAGSAGCLLAAGLSAEGKRSVLLLEAGPTDCHPYVRIPLGYGLLFQDKVRNYRYSSVEEPTLNGRQIYVPRGRTVGGSGSINAMVYCRGMPSDYESWKAEGLTGWGWDDVRPYFEANERRSGEGQGITITDPISERHAFTQFFSQAALELGVRCTDDFNGPDCEGVGFYHVTTRNGQRDSSASAFLRPALRRRWVRLLTGATVQRIEFVGKRATGVTFLRRGRCVGARSRRAVVLSAGAINSPQLLQISGIGDPTHLRRIGVDVVQDNVNVGSHLQDHLFVGYQYRSRLPTLNQQFQSLWAKARHVARYAMTRRGPLSNSVNQFGGFVRSQPGLSAPDLQLYFNPATYTIARSSGGPVIQPDPFPGYTLGFQPTRPASRGSVVTLSPEISAAPRISMNPVSTDADHHAIISGGRFVARFVQSQALRSVTTGCLSPSPETMSDAEILEDFRARSTSTFHPCGTCRMGVDEEHSVVDPRLKVHGVDGLFVADASIFPSVTSGNTNAPTLMVARKACGLIAQAR